MDPTGRKPKARFLGRPIAIQKKTTSLVDTRSFGSSAESVGENQLANDSEVTKHGVSNENAADESHHRFQNGFFEA